MKPEHKNKNVLYSSLLKGQIEIIMSNNFINLCINGFSEEIKTF